VSNPEFMACRNRLLFEYNTLSNKWSGKNDSDGHSDNVSDSDSDSNSSGTNQNIEIDYIIDNRRPELFHLKNDNTTSKEPQSKESGTFKRKTLPRCRMMKMDPLNASLS
jgi:hypothetical protein